MKIIISDKAKDDLFEIKSYLKQNFPKHIKFTILSLKQSFLNLLGNKFLGVETNLKNIRVYITPSLPYAIYYKLDNKNLYILRIYHESRNPNKTFH